MDKLCRMSSSGILYVYCMILLQFPRINLRSIQGFNNSVLKLVTSPLYKS